MLNKFIINKKKLPGKITVPRRNETINSTGSFSSIRTPSDKKYLLGTKNNQFSNKLTKVEKTISTGSIESIIKPSDNKFLTGIKSSETEKTFISTKNIIGDFHGEILEYSARYVKKHIDWWNEEENTITLANTLLDYGTEGPGPENFEVIVNGIHSPSIYNVKQDDNNVVVTFTERLFTYDGLQKENVIIIGKLLDIVLLTEKLTQNSVVITDEFGEALIL